MKPKEGKLRAAAALTAPVRHVSLLALMLLVPAGLVEGQDIQDRMEAEAPDPALSIGFVYFDVAERNEPSLGLELIYRWPGELGKWLQPQLGAFFSSQGAAYGHVGFQLPIAVGREVELIPSLAAGGYKEGTGMKLGSAIQFRSSIQVDWRIAGEHGLSFFFYHVSNAGLGSSNPGAEVVGVAYRVSM